MRVIPDELSKRGSALNNIAHTKTNPEVSQVLPVSYTHLPSPRDLSTSRMPSSA